jgi:hypothetical protein
MAIGFYPSPITHHPSPSFSENQNQFPYAWSETEDCWIAMPDGVRLAAKL